MFLALSAHSPRAPVHLAAEHPFAGTSEFKNWFGQVVYCPDKLQCGDFVANFVCQDGHPGVWLGFFAKKKHEGSSKSKRRFV